MDAYADTSLMWLFKTINILHIAGIIVFCLFAIEDATNKDITGDYEKASSYVLIRKGPFWRLHSGWIYGIQFRISVCII